MNSIFIIGEQRSGSNLLRLMLDKSPQIAAPHPPHILQRMTPLLPLYGNLNINENFIQLIEDSCRLIETNPVEWIGVKLDRNRIYDNCKKNTLIAVFGAIMSSYGEYHKSDYWACKSMQNIRWIDGLEAYFDEPKYIFLHRDPRDVALSFSKAVVGHKHPYFITKQWLELNQLCFSAKQNIPSDRFFSLKYEDLIKDSKKILIQLCAFLKIEYSDSMLNFYESIEAQNTAKVSMLWDNVTNPVLKQNAGKYKIEMNKEDLSIIESLAGDIMDKLEYERTVSNDQLKEFNTNDISHFKSENNRLILEKSNSMDIKDLEMRKKQLAILEEIKDRGALSIC